MADKFRVMIKDETGGIMYSARWLDENPLVTIGRLEAENAKLRADLGAAYAEARRLMECVMNVNTLTLHEWALDVKNKDLEKRIAEARAAWSILTTEIENGGQGYMHGLYEQGTERMEKALGGEIESHQKNLEASP